MDLSILFTYEIVEIWIDTAWLVVVIRISILFRIYEFFDHSKLSGNNMRNGLYDLRKFV